MRGGAFPILSGERKKKESLCCGWVLFSWKDGCGGHDTKACMWKASDSAYVSAFGNPSGVLLISVPKCVDLNLAQNPLKGGFSCFLTKLSNPLKRRPGGKEILSYKWL